MGYRFSSTSLLWTLWNISFPLTQSLLTIGELKWCSCRSLRVFAVDIFKNYLPFDDWNSIRFSFNKLTFPFSSFKRTIFSWRCQKIRTIIFETLDLKYIFDEMNTQRYFSVYNNVGPKKVHELYSKLLCETNKTKL